MIEDKVCTAHNLQKTYRWSIVQNNLNTAFSIWSPTFSWSFVQYKSFYHIIWRIVVHSYTWTYKNMSKWCNHSPKIFTIGAYKVHAIHTSDTYGCKHTHAHAALTDIYLHTNTWCVSNTLSHHFVDDILKRLLNENVRVKFHWILPLRIILQYVSISSDLAPNMRQANYLNQWWLVLLTGAYMRHFVSMTCRHIHIPNSFSSTDW